MDVDGVDVGDRHAPPTYGLALSGGGYRAAAWGLGVIAALANAREADASCGVPSMVTSVSGGSLASAWVAMSPQPFHEQPRRHRSEQVAAVMARLAGNRTAWLVGLTLHVAAAALMGVAEAQDRSFWFVVAGVVGVLVVATAPPLARWSGDLLFGQPAIWWYLDVWLMGTSALVGVAWRASNWWAAAAIGWLSVVALARGVVVGRCMGRSLCALRAGSAATTLADLPDSPLHIFCATDLHAGDAAYLAKPFVYSGEFGIGRDMTFRLDDTVQASANLPGAFGTRWFRSSRFAFSRTDAPRSLALSDGGVYDNMAEEWYIDLDRRLLRLTPTAPGGPGLVGTRPPDRVVVANASRKLGRRKVGLAAVPLLGELVGLLQVKDVLYDGTTTTRRRMLVKLFDERKPAGTLIHIATSPVEFPLRVAAGHAAGCQPADGTAAVTWVRAQGRDDEEWAAVLGRNVRVGTVLWPLGRTQIEELVDHAFCQTIANLRAKGWITTLPTQTTKPWQCVDMGGTSANGPLSQ